MISHLQYLMVIFLLFTSCAKKIEKQFGKVEVIENRKFDKEDKMNIKEFWKIIEYSNANSANDRSIKEKIIIEKLSTYSPEQIIEFEIIFRNLVIQADDFKILAAQEIIEGGVSDDSYLYFRCWLISKGEMIYSQAINNPETLANFTDLNESSDFEELMYVATEAYKIKTSLKEEDENFPREIAFNKGLDYDFGALPTKGSDWNGKDLSEIYPKLWNKFK